MSDDERIQRLTELARKVWPGSQLHQRMPNWIHSEHWFVESADGADVLRADHHLALDALEAALLALAGEKSLIALLLEGIAQRLESHATELRATDTGIGSNFDEVYRELAAELRAAAKEVP